MHTLAKRGISIKRFFMTTLQHIFCNMGRGWLVVWMLLVPLIHIHPEIAHSHGAHEHIHGSQYHSVFSDDQSQEFHKHFHSAHSHYLRNTSQTINGNHLYDHVYNPPEIGFSFLTKSGADLLDSPGPAKLLLFSDCSYLNNICFLVKSHPSQGSPFHRLLGFHLRVRPPPFLSL